MKSILISIRPEWCMKIASGKKTIEVRKTRPKRETPFKCYIYCTKAQRIGFDEFYADPIEADLPFGECGNEKVIGEFICNAIDAARANNGVQTYYNIPNGTCLTDEQLIKYAAGKTLYLWHISDLKIYDEPKELGHFIKPGYEEMETLEDTLCNYCSQTEYGTHKGVLSPRCGCLCCEGRWCESSYEKYLEKEFSLKHPPQSWCYVEEVRAEWLKATC